MSKMRMTLAIVMTVIVSGLMVWQISRERRIAACVAAGRIWNGPTSSCEPPRPAPILQRDNLKRT